jgi:CHAD domain-containing protein
MRSARQALLAQLDKAIEGLSRRGRADQAIHDTRKELKRARAALRLLRKCIGVAEYRRENALIRDAARPLTPARDAKVLLDTLRRWDPRKGSKNPGIFMHSFYGILRKQRHTAQLRLRRAPLIRSAGVLRAIRRRIAAFPEKRLQQANPTTGLERVYKSGYKAFAHVRKRRTDDGLHEWRKQAKYFEHQLYILVPFDRKRFTKSQKKAHRLADQLGDDHDLALLTQQILRHAARAKAGSEDDSAQTLISCLARQRKALQRNAFQLGRRLYSSKPRRYRP